MAGVAAGLSPRDVVDIWLRLDAALDNAGFVEPRRAFNAPINTLVCGADPYPPLRTVINGMDVFPEIRAITSAEIRAFSTYDTPCDFLARLRHPGRSTGAGRPARPPSVSYSTLALPTTAPV